MRGKILLTLALFTLLIGATSISTQKTSARLDRVVQNIFPISSFVLVGALLGTIIYMIGQTVRSARWIAIGKDTIFQAFYTLFLLVFFVFIYETFSTVLIGLFSSYIGYDLVSDDPFEIAKRFLVWVYVQLTTLLIILFQGSLAVESILKSLIVYESNAIPITIRFNDLAAFLNLVINMSMGILLTSFFINSFQILLLSFVEDSLLKIILPLGVILRFLPFSRKAGSILIAIALGTYIITPLVYLMDIGMLQKISDNANQYKELKLVSTFYNSGTMKNIIGKTPCGYAGELYQNMLAHRYDILGNLAEEITSDNQNKDIDKCLSGWDITKAGFYMFMELPTSMKVILGGGIMMAGFGKIAPFFTGKMGILKVGAILKQLGASAIYITLGAMLIIIASQLLTSFVIVSIIIPFINLTIIILFMREFSLRILDAPLNLGHLERLI